MKDFRLEQIRMKLYGKGYPPTINEADYLFKKIDELVSEARKQSPSHPAAAQQAPRH